MNVQDTREQLDLVVVGGGKGGKTLVIDLAKHGYTTALIERDPDRIGGTCMNVACIPTKALVQSATVANWVRRAGGYGIGAELTGIAMTAIRERKQRVVGFMRGGNEWLFTHTSGLEFLLGTAHFIGDKTVQVRLLEGGRARPQRETGGDQHGHPSEGAGHSGAP